MAINAWWGGNETERYWVEITGRPDLGVNLHTPKTSPSGLPSWGYELINLIQPDDIVFHWRTALGKESSGLVAWSIATGEIEDTTIEWQAHGAHGRAAQLSPPRPAWLMPLTDYTQIKPMITYSHIKAREAEIRAVEAALRQSYGTLYFPFSLSDKRPIRTTQTYLAKFPRALAELLGVADAASEFPQAAGADSKPVIVRSAGQGYMNDSRVRSAIERRAVEVAVSYYRKHHGIDAVTYTGDRKPYDLEVKTSSGMRRVEIKGTTGGAETVELTSNEVDNARTYPQVDLFVVFNVRFKRLADGNAIGFGGTARLWENWRPHQSSLKAIRFRHALQNAGYNEIDTD